MNLKFSTKIDKIFLEKYNINISLCRLMLETIGETTEKSLREVSEKIKYSIKKHHRADELVFDFSI